MRAYERKHQYDKLGNVEQVKQLGTNGFTRDFSYFSGKNTLEKIENPTPATIQAFTYDDAGNQITAGSNRNYVWNAANQLITYYNQAGGSDPTIFAQYDYNGGGERVSKLVRTGTAGAPVYERTIYIDGIFEYHILENGSTYEKNYVHVMDASTSSAPSRVAMVRIGDQFPDDISDSITYNLEDRIGSSTVRLNTTGGVIDKEEYYPFGDSSLRTFSKKRYRYVGKEKDIESGLYYYGARYYAAWTCRFISVDPLAADYPFYTPYNYAGNKPINKRDIDGMQEENVNENIDYEFTKKFSKEFENQFSEIKSNSYIKKYSKNKSIKLDYKRLDDSVYGQAYYKNGKHTIEINSKYISQFTDEAILLSTIEHELIHTKLNEKFNSMIKKKDGNNVWKTNAKKMYPGFYSYYKKYGYNDSKSKKVSGSTRDWQHNWMADYARDDIIKALKEHDGLKDNKPNNNIDRSTADYTSDQWYEAMSFAGLEGTKAWNNLSKEKRTSYKKIIKSEQSKIGYKLKEFNINATEKDTNNNKDSNNNSNK